MTPRPTLPGHINGFELIETEDLCPECWGEVVIYDGERICLDCLEHVPVDDTAGETHEGE